MPAGPAAPRPTVPVRSRRRRWTRLVGGTVALALTGLGLAAAPADARPVAAVALGDSYASGEGLAPYVEGTDTATDQCHRSTLAYPSLLATGRKAPLRRVRSVACSGAVTGSLVADLPGASDEPPQLSALRRSTRTVTLTIGGNDIGFAPVLGSCVYTPLALPELQQVIPGRPGCAGRLDAVVTARTLRLAGTAGTSAQFPGTLTLPETLQLIHRRSPKATVYVTGYPRLFGLSSTDPAGCRVGQLGQVPLYVTGPDLRWIRTKVDGLNAAIAASVRAARARGIAATYVDVATPFTSHNVCSSGAPWVNGLLFTPTTPPQLSPASFHPNARGQQAYATAVARAIASSRPRT